MCNQLKYYYLYGENARKWAVKNLRICENIDIGYIHSESVSSSYWPKWGGKELKELTSLASSNKGISVHKT